MGVADAIAAAVLQLVKLHAGPSWNVVTRAVCTRLDSDTPPIVVLAVLDEGREPATADDHTLYAGEYTLQLLVAGAVQGVQASISAGELRQRLRRELVTLNWGIGLLGTLDDVTQIRRPREDAQETLKGRSRSILEFTVRTLEAA